MTNEHSLYTIVSVKNFEPFLIENSKLSQHFCVLGRWCWCQWWWWPTCWTSSRSVLLSSSSPTLLWIGAGSDSDPAGCSDTTASVKHIGNNTKQNYDDDHVIMMMAMRIEPADGLTPLSSTLPGKVSILITSEDIDDEGYKWQEKGQVNFSNI